VHDQSLSVLTATAAVIGVVHTLAGPDHYVPFIVMARARRWSVIRTSAITLACGLAHVASSVAIGALGIALGWTVLHLEWVEGMRGELAIWLLLGFGLAYMVWGMRHAHHHRHAHGHPHGGIHHEPSAHASEGAHHDHTPAFRMTPWVLFLAFAFGPCEPLIPILMYPAAASSWEGLVVVTLVFALCTLLTMTMAVLAGRHGLARLSLGHLERYSHALAGLAVFACGVAIKLGL
jgi:ABC-type nickel/cobalt efflux system permease component RcnA